MCHLLSRLLDIQRNTDQAKAELEDICSQLMRIRAANEVETMSSIELAINLGRNTLESPTGTTCSKTTWDFLLHEVIMKAKSMSRMRQAKRSSSREGFPL